MNIVITGANGYIGCHLYRELLTFENKTPIPVMRKKNEKMENVIFIEDINRQTQWQQHLSGANVVIHLAARAHRNNEVSHTRSLTVFRETNTLGTLNLARQAADAGVKRFIFISSIGVNGNQTLDKPFNAIDTPNPAEPYAISKYEAEIELKRFAAQSSMEIVIIRPPLVYGANAPGNFGKLIHTVARGIPLPLGTVNNRRSLVALPNLTNLITTCIDHPAAANQTFLVSDGEDLSTTELLERLGIALGRSARLLPVPQKFLVSSLKLLGKETLAQRLCGNLQIDMSKTRELLGWNPPISVSEALKQTAQDYLQQHLYRLN